MLWSRLFTYPMGVPMDDRLHAEAVAWCRDCFADTPDDLTGPEAVDCVARQYPGGIDQFMVDTFDRVVITNQEG